MNNNLFKFKHKISPFEELLNNAEFLLQDWDFELQDEAAKISNFGNAFPGVPREADPEIPYYDINDILNGVEITFGDSE